MKTASAVIGAHYGDEGKGLAVDYLSRQVKSPIVVRYNSGAQCSHTVVSPNGPRHIFGHLGAGTFAWAPTVLSKFFVSNPFLLDKELPELKAFEPTIYADGRGFVTTPFDMILNQIVEESRGDSRHGSCGIGFNETIERSLHSSFRLTVEDLRDPGRVEVALRMISQRWVPERLKALGVTAVPEKFQHLLDSKKLRENFIESCVRYSDTVLIMDNLNEVLNDEWENVIFEGGQGLILDEFSPDFPHVTRSRTGLPNILSILDEVGYQGVLDVNYMTRWYVTRHGAGPFPTENKRFLEKYPNIQEKTNVPNPWQGTIRYGELNPGILWSNIDRDFSSALHGNIRVKPSIFLTCMDQYEQTFVGEMSPQGLIQAGTGMQISHVSYGPSYDCVIPEVPVK